MTGRGRFTSWAGEEVHKRGFLKQSAHIGKEEPEQEKEEELPVLPAPGTGDFYQVVFHRRVPVRDQPQQDAPVIDVLIPEMRVELFAGDRSDSWRQIVRGLAEKKGSPSLGWVLVRSEEHGELLKMLPEECQLPEDLQQPLVRQDPDAAILETMRKKRGWLSYKGRKGIGLGEQPLADAARKRCVRRVIDLLWRGYDPNCEDMLGETPLFEVVGSTNADELVLVLLLAQANPKHQANSGSTPLEMAKGTKHHVLLEYFAATPNNPPKLASRLELEEALLNIPADYDNAVRRKLKLSVATQAFDVAARPKKIVELKEAQHFDIADDDETDEEAHDDLEIRIQGDDLSGVLDQVCKRCSERVSSGFRFCAFCGYENQSPKVTAAQNANQFSAFGGHGHRLGGDDDAVLPPPPAQVSGRTAAPPAAAESWATGGTLEEQLQRLDSMADEEEEDEEASPDGKLYRVASKSKLAVRAAARVDAPAIAVLHPGEEATLFSDPNCGSDWRRMETWSASESYCDGWVQITSSKSGTLLEEVEKLQ